MRAKRTRQPAKAVQYLLSADQKLRKLSLRKVTDRVRTAKSRASARSSAKVMKPPTAKTVSGRGLTQVSAAAVVFGVVGIVAAVALIAGRQPVPREAAFVETAKAERVGPAQTERLTPVLRADLDPAIPVTVKALAPEPATRVSTPAPAPKVAAVDVKPAPRPADEMPARAEAPATEAPVTPPASNEAVGPVGQAEPIDRVTISGCLEHDDRGVWLTDASGADTPKARSWRTGFLRKRAPRITLVNSPAAALAYEGRRVSATGIVVDRELRVESLGPIAGECGR